MVKITNIVGISIVAGAIFASLAIPSNAHQNAFQKAGKAIQYTVRKDSSNVSIDTHRAFNKNSVERRKNGRHRHNSIITPGGSVKRMHHK
jgi:hypothetical protein